MEGVGYFLFLGFIAVAVMVAKALNFLANSHPLTTSEVLNLAEKRRRKKAIQKFRYSSLEQPAHVSEKKAMKAGGEFVNADLAFSDAPARIAGMLKAKKHERIVVAFIRSYHVPLLWWNKGPDGRHVYLLLSNEELLSCAKEIGAQAIAILHNHPNPYGSRATSEPSPNDVDSALKIVKYLSQHDISLLEFVCDRGIPYLYFTGFSEAEEPLDPILSSVRKSNGFSRAQNYRMRKELDDRDRLTGWGADYAARKRVD